MLNIDIPAITFLAGSSNIQRKYLNLSTAARYSSLSTALSKAALSKAALSKAALSKVALSKVALSMASQIFCHSATLPENFFNSSCDSFALTRDRGVSF